MCRSTSSPPTTGRGSGAAGGRGTSAPGARRRLVPARPAGARRRSARAVREALAVHYFPGMWSWDRAIVEPLVLAAYDRAGGPSRGAPAAGTASCAGRRTSTAFTPLRVEVDVDVHVPDPVLPDTHLATPGRSSGRATAIASHLVAGRRRRTATGSASIGWCDEFAADDELRARRAQRARVLGVGGDRAGDARSPAPSVHRASGRPAWVPAHRDHADRRREGGRRDAARARGAATCSMRRPRDRTDPRVVTLRSGARSAHPCIAMNRGEDPSLAAGHGLPRASARRPRGRPPRRRELGHGPRRRTSAPCNWRTCSAVSGRRWRPGRC